MSEKINRKGLVFSTDGVVSIIVFLVVMIFIISLWNLYGNKLQESVALEELELLNFQITDLLMKTSGTPTDWESSPTDALALGLRSNPGMLDDGKLTAFLTMDYNLVKTLLNIERFEFEFVLKDDNGNVLNSSGISPIDTDRAVSSSGFMLLNNETRELIFTLWTD
ncbi:MAG: hypothetical protein KKA62_05405 [Nanoarchaeota archaeon]|nr:hypothetical protein [Nanoarchaeota archaeon]MBU1644570.1 hypothetical protein [Nanoarchaeota archaeon]MBU1977359.1 hypothetical protein [Nanoarchaeota archaeon]